MSTITNNNKFIQIKKNFQETGYIQILINSKEFTLKKNRITTMKIQQECLKLFQD